MDKMCDKLGKLLKRIGDEQCKNALTNLCWINKNGGEAYNVGSQVYLKKCPICGTRPKNNTVLSRKVRCDFCLRFTSSINLNAKNKKDFAKSQLGWFINKKTGEKVFVIKNKNRHKYEVIRECSEETFYFHYQDYLDKEDFNKKYR